MLLGRNSRVCYRHGLSAVSGNNNNEWPVQSYGCAAGAARLISSIATQPHQPLLCTIASETHAKLCLFTAPHIGVAYVLHRFRQVPFGEHYLLVMSNINFFSIFNIQYIDIIQTFNFRFRYEPKPILGQL